VASAAEAVGDHDLARDIVKILDDEQFHATYTLRGVYRLALDETEARTTLATVLKDERYHYNKSILNILRGFTYGKSGPKKLSTRSLGVSVRMKMLTIVAQLGIAAPQLPLRIKPAPAIAEHFTEFAESLTSQTNLEKSVLS